MDKYKLHEVDGPSSDIDDERLIVDGEIFDEFGSPVNGVEVNIFIEKLGVFRTTSDREGNYSINVPSGDGCEKKITVRIRKDMLVETQVVLLGEGVRLVNVDFQILSISRYPMASGL